MSRAFLIQPLLDLFARPRYLEIGVFQGETFLSVEAAEKTAVDVEFKFDTEAVSQPGVRFCKCPSDDFFSACPSATPSFDVAFIDGLHEYNQTLRDLMNVITRLGPGGVVVVDDVLPTSYAASLADPGLVWEVKAALGSTEGAWMGDVYRIPFFVRSFLPQFSYATVEGGRELILWQEPRQDYVRETTESVARRDFSDTVRYRDVYQFMPRDEILSRIQALHASPALNEADGLRRSAQA